MRKVTALFLLLIMAVFSMRPVIAMHYCNGELYSFNLYQQQEGSSAISCCHSDKSEASTTIAHQMLTSPWDTCCDDTVLELATDEYRNNTGSFVLRILSSPVEDGIHLFANTSSLKPSVQETDPSYGQLFPPEGLFLKDIDILTYICIYRI